MWSTLLGGHVWRGEMYNRRRDGTIYPEELLHQLGIEHGQGFHWGEPQCFAAATVP